MNRESLVPLSFIIELLNPPLKHQQQDILKLFTELKDIYANYNTLTDTITELSYIDKKTQETKKLIIRNDKIILSNDLTSSTLNRFWKDASYIIEKSVSMLSIPIFFFRQYTIRFIASPLNEKDSRIFLGNRVCGLQDNKLKLFGRPIHGFGIRLVMPSIKSEQNEYNIRVESFLKDTKQIFLENQARFIAPIQLQKKYLDLIENEVNKTYEFLKNNIIGFLEQYN